MRKNILFTFITSLFGLLVAFTGCDDTKEFEDLNVTAVKSLLTPVDNNRIDLQSSGNLLFTWEVADVQDGSSLVYYDILFDKIDGDFSSPIHIQVADKKGLSAGATLTPTVLNIIAEKAGVETGREVTLKWTVRSNRGIRTALSEQSRTITIVRKTL